MHDINIWGELERSKEFFWFAIGETALRENESDNGLGMTFFDLVWEADWIYRQGSGTIFGHMCTILL